MNLNLILFMNSPVFTLYYQNVRGLNRGINDFINEVNCNDFDAIAASESWFKQEREYFSQLSNRYEILRSDRLHSTDQKTKGGGVFLLIKREFNVEKIEIPFKDLNISICTLTKKGCPPLLIALHYFPPDLKVNIMQEYCSWFVNKFINKGTNIIFLGDINVPGIDWASSIITSTHSYIKKKAEIILELAHLLNFTQLNTAYTEADKTKILDVLLLTNVETCSILTNAAPLTRLNTYHPLFF